MRQMNTLELIGMARFLVGGPGFFTARIEGQDPRVAGSPIRRVIDRPLMGGGTSIAAGATATLINQEVPTGQSFVVAGLAGVGTAGLTITIEDGDGNPIISGLFGDIVGANINEYRFEVPHVIVAGSRYIVRVTNTTAAAVTPRIVAKALRVSY